MLLGEEQGRRPPSLVEGRRGHRRGRPRAAERGVARSTSWRACSTPSARRRRDEDQAAEAARPRRLEAGGPSYLAVAALVRGSDACTLRPWRLAAAGVDGFALCRLTDQHSLTKVPIAQP
jgi:hypothetical protein